MATLRKITVIEAKLLMREPGMALTALLTPTVVLVVLGVIPALRRPDEAFGGHSFIDVFCPSLAVISVIILGLITLPQRLATYREKGILRRLSTTPVHPVNLLAAQLLIYVVLAVAAVVLLIAVGKVAFNVPLPRHLLGFSAALLLGMTALFALGLLVAAIAPTARAGSGIAVPLYLLCMFFGGVYLPRFLLPDFLVRIGDFTPPGVQALTDAWTGTGPQPLHLGIMAVTTVVLGAVSAKVFRWE